MARKHEYICLKYWNFNISEILQGVLQANNILGLAEVRRDDFSLINWSSI